MPESGDGLKPSRNRLAEKLHRVGAKASAGITAFSIALGAIGPGHADNPEVPPPHKTEHAAAGLNLLETRSQRPNVLIIPGISVDNQSMSPNQRAFEWLYGKDGKRGGNQADPEGVYVSQGIHERTCLDLTGKYVVKGLQSNQDLLIAGCVSDFTYDETGEIYGHVAKAEQYDYGAGDGSDILVVGVTINGEQWAAIAATEDGSGRTRPDGVGKQVFVNAECKPGGWGLFPVKFLENVHNGKTFSEDIALNQIYLKHDGTYDCEMGNVNTSRVEGIYIEGLDYKSGEKLNTVVSSIFYPEVDGNSPAGFERFYFTKEYGLTRWESYRRIPGTTNSYEVKEYNVFVNIESTNRIGDTSNIENWPFVNTEPIVK